MELRAHNYNAMEPPSPLHTLNIVVPSNQPQYPPHATLKLIEEILQYLTKLINYAPSECIACLRQLLKYLCARNYGNRQPTTDYYATFTHSYFELKRFQHENPLNYSKYDATTIGGKVKTTTTTTSTINSNSSLERKTATASMLISSPSSNNDQQQQKLIEMHANYAAVPKPSTASISSQMMESTSTATATTPTPTSADAVYSSNNKKLCSELTMDKSYRIFGELFVNGLNLHQTKSKHESEYVKHIKLFEPLVINCIVVSTFMFKFIYAS